MKYLLAPAVLFLVTACDVSIQSLEPKFAQVAVGQTPEQVTQIMGKPHVRQESTVLGIQNQIFQWNDLEQKYQVNFIHGFVYEKSSTAR
jgi:hypothetical protein